MRIYQQLEAWVQPQACATSEGNQIDLNSSVWWGGGRTGYHCCGGQGEAPRQSQWWTASHFILTIHEAFLMLLL